jgi:hypothetical protein
MWYKIEKHVNSKVQCLKYVGLSLLLWKDLLKVHKIENFFDSDFGICLISLLVMSKY